MSPRRKRTVSRKRAARAPRRAPTAPRSRPGGRSARVRAAVFKSAFSLLMEKGLEEFSIAEVAARAGVHETTIYRRWRNRNVLALEASLDFSRSALPVPDTGSLRSDLIALMKNYVALMSSPQGQALSAMSLSQHPHVVAAREKLLHSRFASLQSLFERAVARGEFPRDVDSTSFLEMLIAPLYLRRLVTGEPLEALPYEEMIDRLLAAYLG
jgi:AcrR family transcriptional regulator